MIAILYFICAACTFAAIAAFHVLAYTRDVSPEIFYSLAALTLLLCVPHVVLYLRVKKGVPQQEAWAQFWERVLLHCPRWISGTMTLAWFLAVLSFVRTFLGHEFTKSAFHTAWLLMPAGAALSYAVTLMRAPKKI